MDGKVTINHKEIEKTSFACLIFVGIYDRINKKRSNIRGDCIMSQLIDKNGKTEERFLREYDVTQYFRPSVTADAALCVRDRADGGKILLIERGGHPFIGMYAFPGGFTEKDEPCEQTAVRELEEETGYKAKLVHAFDLYPSPGYTDEIIHIYFAEKFVFTGQNLDEGEFLNCEFILLEKVIKMIESGEICDAKTVSAIYRYLYLNNL